MELVIVVKFTIKSTKECKHGKTKDKDKNKKIAGDVKFGYTSGIKGLGVANILSIPNGR